MASLHQSLSNFDKKDMLTKEEILMKKLAKPGSLRVGIQVITLMVSFILKYFFTETGEWTWGGFWKFFKKSVREEFKTIAKKISELV